MKIPWKLQRLKLVVFHMLKSLTLKRVILALMGDESVGGAWIRLLGDKGMSNVDGEDIPELALAVFPEYRGKGIGSKLLREFLVRAKQEHVKAISLSCRVDNVAAMKLYERHGFVRIPNSEQQNRVGGTNVSMLIKLE